MLLQKSVAVKRGRAATDGCRSGAWQAGERSLCGRAAAPVDPEIPTPPGRRTMKSVLTGAVAAALIAPVAYAMLDGRLQQTADGAPAGISRR